MKKIFFAKKQRIIVFIPKNLSLSVQKYGFGIRESRVKTTLFLYLGHRAPFPWPPHPPLPSLRPLHPPSCSLCPPGQPVQPEQENYRKFTYPTVSDAKTGRTKHYGTEKSLGQTTKNRAHLLYGTGRKYCGGQ